MRYALVVNPAARSGKSKGALPKIKAFFERRKEKLTIYKTQKKGDAIEMAKKASKTHGVVIAGGGDGTINEVINGIAGTKAALGIVPMGTTNVLAMELDIPDKPVEACKLIVSKKPVKIDIGQVNGRYFLSWAGIGLDSHMIRDTENIPIIKKILGKISYPLIGLKTLLTYSPTKMSVNADGKRYTGHFILVGNIKYYGGKFRVYPKAEVNDGLLDVCIFKKKSLIHTFKYTLAMGIGQHVNYDDVDYIQAKNIRIDTYDKILIHTDAELASETPAKISIKPLFLKVITK